MAGLTPSFTLPSKRTWQCSCRSLDVGISRLLDVIDGRFGIVICQKMLDGVKNQFVRDLATKKPLSGKETVISRWHWQSIPLLYTVRSGKSNTSIIQLNHISLIVPSPFGGCPATIETFCQIHHSKIIERLIGIAVRKSDCESINSGEYDHSIVFSLCSENLHESHMPGVKLLLNESVLG